MGAARGSGSDRVNENADVPLETVAQLRRQRPDQRADVPVHDPTLVALSHVGHPFFRPRSGPDIVGMVLDAGVDWNEVAALLTGSYCVLAPKRRSSWSTFRPTEGQSSAPSGHPSVVDGVGPVVERQQVAGARHDAEPRTRGRSGHNPPDPRARAQTRPHSRTRREPVKPRQAKGAARQLDADAAQQTAM
jgi:hypothetical protein